MGVTVFYVFQDTYRVLVLDESFVGSAVLDRDHCLTMLAGVTKKGPPISKGWPGVLVWT
jgi:hypothetical protein